MLTVLRKTYNKYMIGAKANYFPLSKYGILGVSLKNEEEIKI